MKIKIYVLTYDDEHHLNTGLNGLFSSNLAAYDTSVFIINNHTNFNLHKDFENRVSVLHNVLQPDFGTGHCGRNWNQALMHGFKDLNNPDCDLVVCIQDDTIYYSNWLGLLVKAHTEMGYEFVACGQGDNLCSYTPIAVKKTALWDERFCGLHYAEHDFFLRVAMYIGDKASINDRVHGRKYGYNFLPFSIIDKQSWVPGEKKYQLGSARQWLDETCHQILKAKWGKYCEELIVSEYVNKPMKPNIPGYIYYPYFEKGIDDLAEKGFNWLYGNNFTP
mgnify:CR=1 FL=1